MDASKKETIINLREKKVCVIDRDKLLVEIVEHGTYITIIRFDPETKTLTVENGELSPVG